MLRNFKRIFAVGICLLTFFGCGNKKLKDVEILNFTPPENGEKIVVLHIAEYGDIKIKLFPEVAPEAVQNFISLVESGYYDEHIIYSIKVDECIKSGDPRGDGTGGKAFGSNYINDELSVRLRNFTGAVGYDKDVDNDGNLIDNTNSSRFYIINTEPANGLTDEFFKKVKTYGFEFPDNVINKYQDVGGAPLFDGGFTVFAQVFSGMNIVYEINKATVNSNLKPEKQIKITSAEVVEFNDN